MPIDHLLRILWRAKLLLLTAAVLAGSLGYVSTQFVPPRYAAEGQLLVESRDAMIPELSQNQPGMVIGVQRIRTEADILRSRRVAEEVVRAMEARGTPIETGPGEGAADRLLATPRAWRAWFLRRVLEREPAPEPERDRFAETVDLVEKHLLVRTADNSSVITVRFRSGSPEEAAAVVNIAMERYLAIDLAAKENTMATANRWLSDRLVQLRADVEAADLRVQQLRRSAGLTQTALGTTDALAVREWQDRLVQAQHDLAKAQGALDSITRRRAGYAEVLGSPLLQQLRDREAEVGMRSASLGQRLGNSHPDRLAAEAELRDIRRVIAGETQKLVSALQRDVETARAQVVETERALAGARTTARGTSDAEVLLEQLTREADARRQIFQAFLARAEQTRVATAQFPSARVVSLAAAPKRPTGLPNAVIAVFSALVGLLLAAAATLLKRAPNTGFSNVNELVQVTGRPNVATLPRIRGGARRGMATKVLEDVHSGVAETLRAMRLTMQALPAQGETRCALVMSAEIGDGKTTLAAALARLSAADGMRTLLIEADLRRPRLGDILGQPVRGRSIESVVVGETELDDAVIVDGRSGLHALLSDRSVRNAQGMLQSPAFKQLIQDARQRYQLIVIDSPPMMRVADALVVAPHSDVILFTVAMERTPRRLVEEAMRRLPPTVQMRTATVATQARRGQLDRIGYYHGYSRPAPALPRASSS